MWLYPDGTLQQRLYLDGTLHQHMSSPIVGLRTSQTLLSQQCVKKKWLRLCHLVDRSLHNFLLCLEAQGTQRDERTDIVMYCAGWWWRQRRLACQALPLGENSVCGVSHPPAASNESLSFDEGCGVGIPR